MASSTIFAAHLLDSADSLMEHVTAMGAGTLATGAKEFAFLTGTRISTIHSRRFDFATPNGLPVGNLTRVDPDNKKYYQDDIEKVFAFTSKAIVQSSRRGRTGASERRTGKTIRGIAQSVRKNDREITEENATRYLCSDMYRAFSEPLVGNREAAIDFDYALNLPLVKHLLGVDKFSIMQHEPQLRRAYEQYIVNNKKFLEAVENRTRFAKGATFIGVEGLASPRPGPYFICTARLKDYVRWGMRLVELMTPLKRYETLPDEFGGIAAICKAHLPGKGEAVSAVHPFGIQRYSDCYYDDVDVVFKRSENMHWTVIPADIAEDAKHVFTF